jgi:hypothetical protein
MAACGPAVLLGHLGPLSLFTTKLPMCSAEGSQQHRLTRHHFVLLKEMRNSRCGSNLGQSFPMHWYVHLSRSWGNALVTSMY